MNIRMQHGLPFISITLYHQARSIQLYQTLLDTGSAGTIVSTDRLLEIGIQYEPNDPIYRIYGVGGSEFVFAKRIDQLTLGDLSLSHFEVEVGAMDYGLEMDAILGVDFLTQVGAVINFCQLRIQSIEG